MGTTNAQLNTGSSNPGIKWDTVLLMQYPPNAITATMIRLNDRKVKLDDENSTIGIIICKDKKDAIVEMTLPEDNNQIFASKYETVLPSKEELQKLLEDKNFE